MTDKTFKDYLTEMHSCGCDDNCSCGGNCTPDCNCHSGCVAIVVSEGRMEEEVDQALLNELKKLKKLAGLPQLPKQPEIDPSLGAGFDPEKGFGSSEDHARDMLQGIKGGPKPGTPEFEKLVQQLTDPSLGAGLIPGKGFPKAPELPPGPVPMPDPTEKPQARFPDGTPVPGIPSMPDDRPDVPDDAYQGLFKKPMKVPPMSNDLDILRRRAGIK